MLARLQLFWTRVRDSLWFLPGTLTLLALGLAFVVTEAERAGRFEALVARSWIFGGGVEGARGVLNAIAGGLITVTGVVFSVTIVALQLASSQFTPRVLRNFTADRGNQLVLGVFIATFTYTLLVLRTVRSAEETGEAFVPRLAVTLAVVLVLVSIGFLIYFINHSARSIQVASILERVTQRTLGDIERIFPDPLGQAAEEPPPDPRFPEHNAAPVHAEAGGYLQVVDAGVLFALGERRRLQIGMRPHIGEFVLPGQPLAVVSPAAPSCWAPNARRSRASSSGSSRSRTSPSRRSRPASTTRPPPCAASTTWAGSCWRWARAARRAPSARARAASTSTRSTPASSARSASPSTRSATSTPATRRSRRSCSPPSPSSRSWCRRHAARRCTRRPRRCGGGDGYRLPAAGCRQPVAIPVSGTAAPGRRGRRGPRG